MRYIKPRKPIAIGATLLSGALGLRTRAERRVNMDEKLEALVPAVTEQFGREAGRFFRKLVESYCFNGCVDLDTVVEEILEGTL